MIAGKGISLFAICIGDSDDINPSLSQDITNNILIEGNIINGLHNPTDDEIGGWYTTNAIAVHGKQVVISNNIISKVTTNVSKDCEAIYTKVVDGIISNNTITDCKTPYASAVIAIKGVADKDKDGNEILKPKSKRIKVFGNIITNDYINFPSSSGITTYGGQEIEIYNNTISNQGILGGYGVGIDVGDSSSLSGVQNISVHDNIISNIYGQYGIKSEANFVKGLKIENNKISNVFGKNSSFQNLIIRVRATTTSINNIQVTGNKFYQDRIDPLDMSSITFLEINPTTTASFLDIKNNTIEILTNNFVTSSLVVGYSFVKGSGDYTNLTLLNSDFKNDVASTKFRYFQFNSSTFLVSQTWLINLFFDNVYVNGSTIDYLYKNKTITDSNYTVLRAENFIELPIITANRVITIPRTDIANRTIRIFNKNNSAFNWSFPADASVRNGKNIGVTNIPNTSITDLYFNGSNWTIMSVSANYSIPAETSSPAFTGTPLAPTATAGTNTTQIATTAFVQTEISNNTVSRVIAPDVVIANGATTAIITLASNASYLGHITYLSDKTRFKSIIFGVGQEGGLVQGAINVINDPAGSQFSVSIVGGVVSVTNASGASQTFKIVLSKIGF